jgi:hypothetical protein
VPVRRTPANLRLIETPTRMRAQTPAISKTYVVSAAGAASDASKAAVLLRRRHMPRIYFGRSNTPDVFVISMCTASTTHWSQLHLVNLADSKVAVRSRTKRPFSIETDFRHAPSLSVADRASNEAFVLTSVVRVGEPSIAKLTS